MQTNAALGSADELRLRITLQLWLWKNMKFYTIAFNLFPGILHNEVGNDLVNVLILQTLVLYPGLMSWKLLTRQFIPQETTG